MFWDFLFGKSVTEEWNLIVCEQDDMRVEEYAFTALQVTTTLTVFHVTVYINAAHQLE